MPERDEVVWEEYRDRSTGLMIFGLIQIAMGAVGIPVALLFAAGGSIIRISGAETMLPAGFSLDRLMPVYLTNGLIYEFFAVGIVALGVGSVLARRWARALALALWTTLLVNSVLLLIIWIFTASALGRMLEAPVGPGLQGGAQPISSLPPFALFLMMVTLLFIGLSLPFVLFYRSRHVKLTCEWRNPRPCWTDSRPFPVLVASFLILMLVRSILQEAAADSFYIGVSLTGTPGIVGAGIAAGVFLCAALGLLRMQSWGLWLAMIATSLEAAVYLHAAATGKWKILGSRPMISAERAAADPQTLLHMLWAGALAYVAMALFLLWLRRYFRRVPVDLSVV